MICPHCGKAFKSTVAVAGGRSGGQAKVAKGFASPDVLKKALATRKRNAKAARKNSPNASGQPRLARKETHE